MPQTILGLDIGATSIKITRLEASLFRFEFKESVEHPLPTHMDLPWEQLVSSILQVIFSDRGARPEKIIASLPGRFVSTRILRLPFTDKKKIEQTVPFELEGQVPFPIEDVLIDYQILETTSGGSTILVIWTPKKVVENHLELLKNSGIDPQILIPPAISLANLCKEVHGDNPESFVILDIGDSETAMCLVAKGQLRFCRTLVIGSSRLTRDLKEAMEIPHVQAMEIKEKEADLSPTTASGGDPRKEFIAGILKRSLEPLIVGIQQGLISARETTGIKPNRIYLCGKGAKLKGLQTYLASELNQEVLIAQFNRMLGPSHPPQENDSFVFSTSMSLALHGTREHPASRFNLRTGEYSHVSGYKAIQKVSVSAGAMLAILLALFLVNGGLKYHYRHLDYTRIQSAIDQVALEIFPDIQSLPGGKPRISALTTRLEEEKREMNLFANIAPDSLSVLDILLAITNAVPQDVKIDVRELNMEGDKIRIQAETGSSNAAEQIKNNILQSGMFANADIPEVKDSLDHNSVKFQMILQLQSRTF